MDFPHFGADGQHMASRECAQCGHHNLVESNFCSSCGARLALGSGRPAQRVSQVDVAERKLVSIVFADIVNSTAIVEGLDPEDALDELRPAIQAMRTAVKRFGGTLCREQGDGIMAFFGAPRADDHHSVNACLAAVEIVRSVEHLTHRKMHARAGIHSGEVVMRLIEGELGPSYDASGAVSQFPVSAAFPVGWLGGERVFRPLWVVRPSCVD